MRTVTVDRELFLNLLVYAETRSSQLTRARVEALQRLHAEDTPANQRAYASAVGDAARALDTIRAADKALVEPRRQVVIGIAKRVEAPTGAYCWNCSRRGTHASWCPVIPLEERVLPLVPAEGR